MQWVGSILEEQTLGVFNSWNSQQRVGNVVVVFDIKKYVEC